MQPYSRSIKTEHEKPILLNFFWDSWCWWGEILLINTWGGVCLHCEFMQTLVGAECVGIGVKCFLYWWLDFVSQTCPVQNKFNLFFSLRGSISEYWQCSIAHSRRRSREHTCTNRFVWSDLATYFMVWVTLSGTLRPSFLLHFSFFVIEYHQQGWRKTKQLTGR